jgi:hypothetical protein
VPKARATRIWRASPTSVERTNPGITTAAARTMRCEAEGSDTGLDYSRANRFGCPPRRAGRCTGTRMRHDRITRAGDADPGSPKGGEEESIALLRAPYHGGAGATCPDDNAFPTIALRRLDFSCLGHLMLPSGPSDGRRGPTAGGSARLKLQGGRMTQWPLPYMC